MEEQTKKPPKKKRTGCIIAVIIFVVLPIVVISVCMSMADDSETSLSETGNPSIEFERVGYWKDGKMRVYTYNVIFEGTKDSIPNFVWNKIEKHGKSQSYTDGGLTHGFYYLKLKGYANLNEAPDVTLSNNLDQAYDKALESKPIMLYSININGKTFSKKYPKN
jgi:hypothetical protein